MLDYFRDMAIVAGLIGFVLAFVTFGNMLAFAAALVAIAMRERRFSCEALFALTTFIAIAFGCCRIMLWLNRCFSFV